MDRYVTGPMIKRLSEARGLTQLQLAGRLNVSDKAVSKWETGRGYPDITLLEALADALGVSVTELLAGEDVVNTNKAFNMLRTKLYVCPVCGNIVQSTGEAVVSCCGITLPLLEAEPADEDHPYRIERVEDEYFISLPHEMSKTHHISFIAALRSGAFELIKLYPEGPAEARFKISGTRQLLIYCNRHGLFKVPVPPRAQ